MEGGYAKVAADFASKGLRLVDSDRLYYERSHCTIDYTL